MAIQVFRLNVDSSKAFSSTRVELSGTVYVLTFRYAQRLRCFYLDVALEDGTPIASGRKIVPKYPMLLRCVHPRRPPGDIWALPQGTDDSTPNLGELGPGKRVELLYVIPASVSA